MPLQILVFLLSGFVIGVILLVKGADIFVSGEAGLPPATRSLRR